MGIFAVISSIILVIAAGIYYYYKKSFSYFEKHGVPHLKPSFPLGNIQGIGTKYHMAQILINHYNELKGKGPIAGFYNLTQPEFLVTDLELVKTVTVKNFNSFVNRGMYYNERDEPLSAHMVAIEDDRWRFLRNKLSPVFTSGKLRSMYSIIYNLGEKLVKSADKMSKNGSEIELKNLISRFTVDVVSSTTFGMDSNTLNGEHEELIEIAKEVFGTEGPSAAYFFFLTAFPDFSRFIGLRLFTKKVSEFFTNVVGGNIKHREQTNDNRSDFLNMLIQLKNKGSIDGEFSSETKKLTMNEVLAQAFIFFFAGTDTSSVTASYALTELAYQPNIQERLRKEIQEMTKDTKGEINYENLHEMTYLNQVVNETLRMHTPGFGNLRTASEDFKVPGTDVTIPKGSKVWVPTLGFHFDEKYWTNPKKFDPDRFTPEETAKRPPQCYFPFGEGPRNCVGMRFALLNVKFAVAVIVKNFKITPAARMKYPFEIDPVAIQMVPKGDFWVHLEKIN